MWEHRIQWSLPKYKEMANFWLYKTEQQKHKRIEQKKKDGQERDGKHKLFPKIAEVHNVLKKQKQTKHTHARTHTHTHTRTKTSLTVDIQFDNLEQSCYTGFLFPDPGVLLQGTHGRGTRSLQSG